MTFNARICDTVGRSHRTLFDRIYAIEYVDAAGHMQTLCKDIDPHFMTAAVDCFGLLGIVIHLTPGIDPVS